MRPGTAHYDHARSPKVRTSPHTATLLAYLREYIAEHSYGPTLREMMAAIGVSTPSVAAYHLERLRADGLVTFEDGKSRTVRLLE